MSIRLKLTVLYTGILALTLVVFSFGVYGLQVRTSFQEARNKLESTGRIIDLIGRAGAPPDNIPMPDFPRERFPSQPYWSVRDASGTVLRGDPNLDNVALPISADAQTRVLTTAESTLEIGTIGTERFLVHNQSMKMQGGEKVIVQVGVSLAQQDLYLHRLGRLLALGSGMMLLLAIISGWWLSGYTLRPINQLTRTAQAIGAERDFSKRVDYIGPADEIGQLATTFNNMLSQLEDSYQQMAQSLESQRRFVADASHELRTPLTTIRGNLGLLQRNPPIPHTEQTDILDDMLSETERLMRLVGGLLVLARADARQTLPLSNVALDSLLNEVCRQAQTFADGRSVHCEVVQNLTILANRDALKQVLLALIDNAVKHTPIETAITIKTYVTDDNISIVVADNGGGIPAEQLPHIFDRFYRGDIARTGDGAGLGLAIVKELVEAQGGSIEVDSVAGQGARFSLKFSHL